MSETRAAQHDTPPATGSQRAWTRVELVLAAAVIGWALVLAAVVALRNGQAPPEPSDTPTEAATARVPERDEPPTAAEIINDLEIDTGFTPGEVTFCAGNDPSRFPGNVTCPSGERGNVDEAISYGIVIENTGDHVLRGITVSYRFLDADDEPIGSLAPARGSSDRINLEARILPLVPGEAVALGDSVYLEHNDVATVDVDIIEDDLEAVSMAYHENFDLPHPIPQSGSPRFNVSATDIEVTHGEPDGRPMVSYTIESQQDTQAQLLATTVIFRNADGAIVGGARGDPDNDFGAMTVPPNDPVRGQLAVDDPMAPMAIPDIDPDQTEISLFPYRL